MAGDDAQERGLARAVAAEQPGDRIGLEVEGDVVQGNLAAVAAGQPGYRDRGCHSLAPPCIADQRDQFIGVNPEAASLGDQRLDVTFGEPLAALAQQPGLGAGRDEHPDAAPLFQ